MKKGILAVLALVFVFAGLQWFKSRLPSTPTLHVVAWSGYFTDKIITEFTSKTGLKVELSYISSNEELFSKLKAGATGYDLILPSDYMVEQMTKLSMLEPLQRDLLPHLSHLDPYYSNLPYDRGLKFTVPFTRGTTGVLVNIERVKLPPEPIGWDFLLASSDPTHTSLLDDMREVFSSVMLRRGLNPNSENPEDTRSVAKEIQQIKRRIALFSSEPLNLVLREDITIAHAFSTHGIQAARANKKFRYLLPKEGNTVWTDNYAIPKTSSHIKEAHLFIDYFLNPENALKLVQENHLNTPNRTAWLKLDRAEQQDPTLYPSEAALKKMIFLRMIDRNLQDMSNAWTEIKS